MGYSESPSGKKKQDAATSKRMQRQSWDSNRGQRLADGVGRETDTNSHPVYCKWRSRERGWGWVLGAGVQEGEITA